MAQRARQQEVWMHDGKQQEVSGQQARKQAVLTDDWLG